MPLSAGDRLGPYEILAPVGAGGMGEVYQAHDTRLHRTVAIKVSKDQFNERFEREARAVAALNHPNICHLYDVGPNYLVMEFVEGGSPQGPLPLDEVLRIAAQIAEALAEAHEKGIVHRDLKPANIKITSSGQVKVLDFGLAKMTAPETTSAPLADSPTLTMAAATQVGVILGTAGYMSPEQARGKNATARADIWAFGVVLYELLTGRRTFDGEDVTETLASIVKDQPDLNAVPFEVRRLIEACLQKDPKKRLQAIGDWRLLLNDANPPAAVKPRTSRLWPAIAGVFAVLAAAVSFLYFHQSPPLAESLKLSIALPPDTTPSFLALSPDGRRLAVSLVANRKGQLYVRALDSSGLRLLEGTDGARTPFWSPDSRFVGFFADGKLKVVPAAGGPTTTLCGETGLGQGGTWSRAGVILFATDDGEFRRVSASGGQCTAVELEGFHGDFPEFLPDGIHFLCVCGSPSDLSTVGIYVAAPGTKPRKILNDVSNALYSPPASGKGPAHLLFLRESSLMAQPLDPDKLEPLGDPFAIASPVSQSFTPPQAAASVARNGTLIFTSNSGPERQLTWFDHSGKQLEKAGEQGKLTGISLSPDGNTVARNEVSASDPLGGIVLLDLARNSQSRFTSIGRPGGGAVWSPDGTRIAYTSNDGPNGNPNLYVREVNGGGRETPLLPANTNARHASDWSRDGRFLIYTEIDPKTRADIWYLRDPGKPGSMPVKFLATDAIESQGQLSPDGRWLAYYSNEGDVDAVYVRDFPSGDRTIKIADRAGEPRWSKDGSELFYLARTDRPTHPNLMAVAFQVGAAALPRIGTARKVLDFEGTRIVPQGNLFSYAPYPDGKRFLVNVSAAAATPGINVITNWQQLTAGGSK